MSGFYVTNNECSGCGLRSCDGRCFLECEADYPEEDMADRVEREMRTVFLGEPLV